MESERVETAASNDVNPLISVVMPTYKGDSLRYLEQAVRSILVQTYTALELIVVTDGPVSDETNHFLDALIAVDPRVRTIRMLENRGQASARNYGIGNSRGRFVALLDADDLATPNRLERQRNCLESTGAGLVGSFYRLIDEAGNVTGGKEMPVSDDAIRSHLCAFNPIANSTVFARAEVLQENPFPEGYRLRAGPVYGEDYALWVTLATKGVRMLNVPEYLVDFRIGSDFFARRRGINRFRTDLGTKLRAVRLYPPLRRPWAAFLAVTSSLPRLMPTAVLKVAYWTRMRFRFSGGFIPPHGP